MERSVNTARNNRGSPAHPAISQRSHSRPARAFNTYLDLLNTYSNAMRRRRGFLSRAVSLPTTEVRRASFRSRGSFGVAESGSR